jgi:hypothetical protein
MSATHLIATAEDVASSDLPERERLGALIELVAQARALEDPSGRLEAELGILRAAWPLLERTERPVRAEGPAAEPVAGDELAREVAAMRVRIARRRALAPEAAEVPVEGPRWSSAVLDVGDEVLAVHRDTAAPYPVALFVDLDAEASAAVVAGRLARRGFDPAAIAAVLEALEVAPHSRRRVLEALRGGGES